MADAQHDRNCRRRSLSPRNCARHDSRPCGRAGAIAGEHSTPASRETPRKRTSRREHARNYSNARTCSLRSELVTSARLAQEISGTFTAVVAEGADLGRTHLWGAHAPRVSAGRTDSSRGELAMTPSSSRTSHLATWLTGYEVRFGGVAFSLVAAFRI